MYVMTSCDASQGLHCDHCGQLIRASIYLSESEQLCRDCVPRQDVQGFFERAAESIAKAEEGS